MYACVFLKAFFISVAACWGESGHCAPRQLQTHTFHSWPLSPLTSRAFTLLTENNESGCGMYISVAENFHCIFRHFLEKQRMFCWGPFSSSASVIPIRLPSVPAYGSPRAKPQEMRYWYDPREVRKGHLFHRCRWQNSRRKPRGQGKYERGRVREEMRYGMSKRAGCVSFVAY